jgi:APA family basic amino acid/polyamine antiporter
MAAKGSLGCELTNAWTSQTLNVETGSWLPISGTALISGISAALVGSMFLVSLGKGDFIAGEIKNQNVMGLSLF